MGMKHFIFVCVLAFMPHFSESAKAGIVKITDKNWPDVLEGDWLIKFYAPWCPACKSIAPTWTELSQWSQELDTSIAEVDVTEEPGLSGRFLVTSLPTIYHATNGVFRRYLGPRTKDDFINLIEEKKYEEISQVSWWQAPNSFPMAVLSWVFKMSMIVRVTHTIMTEDYGFPVWSSYGFFAIITIFLGLLLGVLLVMIADCFWPVKGRPRKREVQPPAKEGVAPGGEKKRGEEEEEKNETSTDDTQAETTGDQEIRKRKTEKESDTSQSDKAS